MCATIAESNCNRAEGCTHWWLQCNTVLVCQALFLQADDQEFMDWEQKTAIKRSEGTFFKNLYRIKKELPGAQTAAAVNTEVRIAFLMSIMSSLAYVIAPSTALISSSQVSVSILAKQSLLSCHWRKSIHALVL